MNRDYKSYISVDEAVEIVRAQAKAKVLGNEEVDLLNALGRTLAEDLTSQVDHPSCDNSALDGYACREADTLNATEEKPVKLTLVGDIPAGSVFPGEVGPGEAVGIYTGAPVPSGANAIIGVEYTEQQGDTVLFRKPASKGDIRPRAQDLKKGEVYLLKGTRLTPSSVGIAASMGYPMLDVTRKPRIGILATGDEVIDPGEPIRDGQVYNSNAYSVASLIQQAGGVPVLLPKVEDNPEKLKGALEALGGVDLLITSGGVSMGKYDFVRDLLFDEGTVHFWKVAMKPGGPAIFGEWRGLGVFGLPGNPVSSMVVFSLLTKVWLDTALGSTESPLFYQRITATAATGFKGTNRKVTLNRATLSFDEQRGYLAHSTGSQSSGVLTSMLKADALVIVPPNQETNEGNKVEVILLP